MRSVRFHLSAGEGIPTRGRLKAEITPRHELRPEWFQTAA